jgi:hypothetical protein
MTNEKSLLTDINPHSQSIKVAKNDQTMEAICEGTVSFKDGILKNVSYVPELKRNLLSVNCVTKNGDVLFTGNKVYLLNKGEPILEGDKTENGLFTVDLENGMEVLMTKKGTKELTHNSAKCITTDCKINLDIRKNYKNQI